MTFTGFTTLPSIKQYYLFVKCFIRSGRETEGKERDREKSVVSKQRFWVKILFSMDDIVFTIAGDIAIWPQCNVWQNDLQ